MAVRIRRSRFQVRLRIRRCRFTSYAPSVLLDNVKLGLDTVGRTSGMYEKIFAERVVHPRAQENIVVNLFQPKVDAPIWLHGSAGMRRNKDASRNDI